MRPLDLREQSGNGSSMQHDLRRCSLEELERLYRTPLAPSVPRGRFRGALLHWLTAAKHHPLWRTVDTLGFGLTPFGVDFDEACWYFWHPRLRTGGFETAVGGSRWRDAQVLQLHYQRSKLPIKGLLYDEVKPLGPDLCLGIGGINSDAGPHFFFALERA